jgi:hypothetical protein
MDNQLRPDTPLRRRPIDDRVFEDVCVALNFEDQTDLLCSEDESEFVYWPDFESDQESEPMTPTRPTVLTSTNAPKRPKRF